MEALVHLKKFHVDLVEQCDKKLMQILFNSPRTVPIEAYYIESSTYPLRFHIKLRRFMYLWTLLRKSEKELVKKVFNAQVLITTNDTWTHFIKEDLKEFEIEYTFDQISLMSKSQFKQIVLIKVKDKAKQYLHDLQSKHVKTKKLNISEKMQPYLSSPKLSFIGKTTTFSSPL